MFQSYQYIKYLGYDNKTNKYSYLIKIIDTDFEEASAATMAEEVAASGALVRTPAAARAAAVVRGAGPVAVIQVYSQRKLNVASNLFLLMEYVRDEYDWSIQQQIEWYQKYLPEYQDYHSEIEKFLCLV